MTDNGVPAVICEPQKRTSNAKQTRACLKKRAFLDAKASAPLLCYSHLTLASKFYCAVIVNGEVEFVWRRRVWMILGEKKTFETKSARQFSRFVPSFNLVCLSVMRALPYGSEPSSHLCFVKTDPVTTAIFLKPWPQTFICRCHALRNVFPGTKWYSQRHEKEIATGTENRGRHLFLVENSSTSFSIWKKRKTAGFSRRQTMYKCEPCFGTHTWCFDRVHYQLNLLTSE